MTAQQLEQLRTKRAPEADSIPLPEFLQWEFAIQLAGIRENLEEAVKLERFELGLNDDDRQAAAATPADAWPPRCGVPLDNDRTCDAPAEYVDLVGRLFICDRHHGEQASVRRVLTGGIPQ